MDKTDKKAIGNNCLIPPKVLMSNRVNAAVAIDNSLTIVNPIRGCLKMVCVAQFLCRMKNLIRENIVFHRIDDVVLFTGDSKRFFGAARQYVAGGR